MARTTCLTVRQLAARAFAIGPRSREVRSPHRRGVAHPPECGDCSNVRRRAAQRLARHEDGRREHRSDGEDGDDRRHRHRRAGPRDADERRGRRADDELQDAEQARRAARHARVAGERERGRVREHEAEARHDDEQQRHDAPHARAGERRPRAARRPALAWTTSAARRIARGSKRRRSARLAWLAPTIPSAFAANSTLKSLRRGAVDVLEHERRARDVGEHRAEREAAGERVADEDAVAEQARRTCASVSATPPGWRSSGASVSRRPAAAASDEHHADRRRAGRTRRARS